MNTKDLIDYISKLPPYNKYSEKEYLKIVKRLEKNLGGTMNEKEFRDYKDNYLNELKDFTIEFLEIWQEHNPQKEAEKLNELVIELYGNTYKRIKTLSYFPEYNLPE